MTSVAMYVVGPLYYSRSQSQLLFIYMYIVLNSVTSRQSCSTDIYNTTAQYCTTLHTGKIVCDIILSDCLPDQVGQRSSQSGFVLSA